MGAYATLRLTLWEPLHLVTGLRYSHSKYNGISEQLCTTTTDECSGLHIGDVYKTDRNGYSAHNLSWPPTYSLVYDLSKSTTIYGGYTDIYQSQAYALDIAGKPLGPVTGSNLEGGVKWSRDDGRLNATLAFYRIEQKNYAKLVEYRPNPDPFHVCCFSANSNQVNFSEGVDVELTGQISPGWQLSAGYTFNRNEFRGSDAAENGKVGPLVSRSPRHLLKLWTSYQLGGNEWLRRVSIGGGVNAQTSSYYKGDVCVAYILDAAGKPTGVCDYANGGSVPYEFTQGFYAIFAARFAYQIDPRWNVALNINNLTDRRYYQTMGSSASGNWYGEPRNFMLTVRGTF